MVPWVLWMIAGLQPTQDEIGIYYTNYGGWWSAFGWSNLSKLFLINLFRLTVNIATIGFSLFDTLVKKFPPTIIICLTFGSITILSILKQIRYNKLLSLYLAGYISVIMLWPWPPPCFIIPILPFLLGYLLNEIWHIVNKYHIKYNIRHLIRFILITILIINLSSIYMIGKSNRIEDYPYPTTLNEPVSWSSYLSIFHWINHRTRPDDLIAAGLDTMVYLYTNRRSFRPFAMNPLSLFYAHHSPPLALADLIRILQAYRPKYLIQTPMPGFSEEKPFSKILHEVGVKYPGLLKTVYVGQDKRFLIYEIQAHLLAATGSSASAGQEKRAGM